MNIAIIPARGGSKRIKNKNIKLFFSKPMIAWTIEILKKFKLFKNIYVTTDSLKIADIAKKYGATIPFIREKDLADDFTPTLPVIKDALKKISINKSIKNICCVYPCTPFVTKNDLIKTYALLKKNRKRFVFPVIKNSHPIERSFKVKKNIIEFIFKSKEMSRTQDLVTSYHDAGQFYWGSIEAWTKNKKLHSGAIAYEVPDWRFVDIDNYSDWKRAEKYFKYKLNEI